MQVAKILLVDDEAGIRHAFQRAFGQPGTEVVTAANAADGLGLFDKHKPDVVIVDVSLPDMSGLDLFRRLRERDSKTPVIFITGHATTQTAIEATKLGAFDYLFKPLELDELRDLVETAIEVNRLQSVPAVLADEALAANDSSDVMVGRCTAMRDVYTAIGRVAAQDVTVLITGESGTGKELVARAIYQHSHRAAAPFLAINCAAIPESLLESELFGHEKGAFTGADRQRIGKFEQCHGGTLFLDEIGDMSPLMQTKILRALAEKRFQRIGGDDVIETDVRLIAATNRDLEKGVSEGSFRQDLYYRLNVFTIRLPALRDRGDDLALLVEHYLRRFNADLGKHIGEIAPEATKALTSYEWPGNVRELQSALKQALLRASGSVLLADFLPDHVRQPRLRKATDVLAPDAWDAVLDEKLQWGCDDLFSQWQALTERHLLSRVMQHTGGNLSQAARILGINRRTLRLKLKSLDIRADDGL